MYWGLKEGISFEGDSGPFRSALGCCGSICHQIFSFIQIGPGHTVHVAVITEPKSFQYFSPKVGD